MSLYNSSHARRLKDKEFIEAVFTAGILESAIDWIAQNIAPEDVFSKTALEDWAESNGFILDES